MSACTEWISALSNGLLALATLGLVGYAGKGLDQWKKERRADAWDESARDILTKGNAVHRSISFTHAAVSGEAIRRWNAHGADDGNGAEYRPNEEEMGRLRNELGDSVREFYGALYIGEVLWGNDITRHYDAVSSSVNDAIDAIDQVRRFATQPIDDIAADFVRWLGAQNELGDQADPVVVSFGNAMRGLATTLRAMMHGTRPHY